MALISRRCINSLELSCDVLSPMDVAVRFVHRFGTNLTLGALDVAGDILNLVVIAMSSDKKLMYLNCNS